MEFTLLLFLTGILELGQCDSTLNMGTRKVVGAGVLVTMEDPLQPWITCLGLLSLLNVLILLSEIEY